MNRFSCPWPVPHDPLRLTPGVVHVWCLPLDVTDAQIRALRHSLSHDERDRAARYHLDRHRRGFIACRGQVRRILAGYLNDSAEQLRFRYGPLGKPALEVAGTDSAIQFNVSNSQAIALCAVTLNRELGVDVEHVQSPYDVDGLAQQFFAPTEVAQLYSLSEDQRFNAFFNCWTRKEAVLKAVGTGLTFPLDKVIVTLAPDEPARLVAFDDDPAAAESWWLTHLDPIPGYVGALAVQGSRPEVLRWRFEMSRK